MSLNPSSLVSTPVNNPSVYVPLNQRKDHKLIIEVPEDPQEALALVEDLYNQASAPTFEEKSKAPYTKNVELYGDITLAPNKDFEGPRYQINENGQVLVTPKPYELKGTVCVQEQATDPKIIEEVQALIAQAKPQEEIPERSLEVGYKKHSHGELELLKKGIDGSDQHYNINPNGSVDVYQTNNYTQETLYNQQIIKPGELPVLKEGEERPVGQALSEAPVEEDAPPPTNGKRLDLQA